VSLHWTLQLPDRQTHAMHAAMHDRNLTVRKYTPTPPPPPPTPNHGHHACSLWFLMCLPCLLSVSASAIWIGLISVQVELKQVGLSSLCLGTCPHLTSLAVATSQLHTMDLKWVLLSSYASLHTLVSRCFCSPRLPGANVGLAHLFGGLLP